MVDEEILTAEAELESSLVVKLFLVLVGIKVVFLLLRLTLIEKIFGCV